MISCHKTYDCMVMTEVERDNILSSGPARFQLLSAHHPGITGRYVSTLGSKLSTSYPAGLFEILLKLEVVGAHLKHFRFTDGMVLSKTRELMRFCWALSNIYQVRPFLFLKSFSKTFLASFRDSFESFYF